MADKECSGCPECNADLSKGLDCVSASHTRYKGNGKYEDCQTLERGLDYFCPDCGEWLTDSEEEADELMGC